MRLYLFVFHYTSPIQPRAKPHDKRMSRCGMSTRYTPWLSRQSVRLRDPSEMWLTDLTTSTLEPFHMTTLYYVISFRSLHVSFIYEWPLSFNKTSKQECHCHIRVRTTRPQLYFANCTRRPKRLDKKSCQLRIAAIPSVPFWAKSFCRCFLSMGSWNSSALLNSNFYEILNY
jgi:hypothetical protein